MSDQHGMQTVSRKAIIIFTLAALFYLYEFILQVSPGVMTDGIMRDFGVGAAGLGFVSAAYFYAYMPMQIPAGLLYDRYGPRLLLTLAILICVVGTFAFTLTNHSELAAGGRFLMGVGSAFSFIGALVLAARWFPAKHYALLVGVAQLLSSVGAMLGETPLAMLVEHFGWRATLNGIGLAGIILAVFMYAIVRDYPAGAEPNKSAQSSNEWQRLKDIVKCKQSWVIAIYAFCIWAPIVVFAGLWGVAFITHLYHVNLTVASLCVSLVWLGVGIGSPTFGWWSDHVQSRTLPLKVSALIGVFSLIVILYVPLPLFWMSVAMFVFGIASSGQVVSFAVVKDINLPDHVGTASGFNNMATVAGGALIQPLVGVLLHFFWQGEMQFGVPVYHVWHYQAALFILPLCYVVAWYLSHYHIKETHCQPIQQGEFDDKVEGAAV